MPVLSNVADKGSFYNNQCLARRQLLLSNVIVHVECNNHRRQARRLRTIACVRASGGQELSYR